MTYAHFFWLSVRPTRIPMDEKDGKQREKRQDVDSEGGGDLGVPTACPSLSLLAHSVRVHRARRVMNDRTDKTSKQMKSGPAGYTVVEVVVNRRPSEPRLYIWLPFCLAASLYFSFAFLHLLSPVFF